MSDPLRTDITSVGEPASDADREAKIEQLLLGGLEHYFAGRYDDAVNVWTRALFLDRSHARARAYIERARTAQAERQRESEELLQQGVAAFDRGDGAEARRLLEAALAQGAPSDQALAVLDRLNRLEQGHREVEAAPHRAVPGPSVSQDLHRSRVAWSLLTLLALIVVGAAAFAAGAFRSNWPAVLRRPPALPTARLNDAPPAVPRRGELALARARALVAGGRLREALTALDVVWPTDPEKPEADRLRAQVQRQLIELSAGNAGARRDGTEP